MLTAWQTKNQLSQNVQKDVVDAVSDYNENDQVDIEQESLVGEKRVLGLCIQYSTKKHSR